MPKKLSLKSVLLLADQMVRVATIARGPVYLSLQLLDRFLHKFDLPFRLIGLSLSTPNLAYTEISSLPISLREGKTHDDKVSLSFNAFFFLPTIHLRYL